MLWKTIPVTFSFMRANPRVYVKFSFFGHPVCDGQFSSSELSSDWQLRVSNFGCFRKVCTFSYVACSFECFRLYIDLQFYVFILSVNRPFSKMVAENSN